MAESYDYLLKLVVIGDSGVGKTEIVTQFIQKRSKHFSEATIGVQFAAKTMQIKQNKVKLHIWDTAGQEKYRSIVNSYYRGAIGALLVYDITRKQTFENIKNWLNQVHTNGHSHIHILLIGNKNDLQEKRQITLSQGQNLAKQLNLSFIEISAKDYNFVQETFKFIIEQIIQKIENGRISSNVPGIKNTHNNLFLNSSILNKTLSKKYNCC